MDKELFEQLQQNMKSAALVNVGKVPTEGTCLNSIRPLFRATLCIFLHHC